MTPRILVTGGAGFIGSHACKALAQAGFLPVAFDNLSTGWEEAVKYGPLFRGDIKDRIAVDAALAEYRPVAVMHFASLALVGESMSDPGLYWRENVNGALTLIEACCKAAVKSFVFSSTCATYGEQDGVMLTETAVQRPINAYGASKRAIEDIVRNFGTVFGLRYVIFRYFNVAGADPGGELGEQHVPETHLIPLTLDAAAGRRPGLAVYGSDYLTPDGTCVRDYVHVSDLVDAHVLGLRWLLDGRDSRVFNLGSSRGFSVREVIEVSRQVTNCDIRVTEGSRRPGDPASLVSASTLAREELGWIAARSTLQQMIRDAWLWSQKPGYKR